MFSRMHTVTCPRVFCHRGTRQTRNTTTTTSTPNTTKTTPTAAATKKKEPHSKTSFGVLQKIKNARCLNSGSGTCVKHGDKNKNRYGIKMWPYLHGRWWLRSESQCGILSNHRWKRKIIQTKYVSDRMITTAICDQRKIKLTTVHFSHSGYADTHNEKMYKKHRDHDNNKNTSESSWETSTLSLDLG